MTEARGSTPRLLVVGSWAKEQITIEHLKTRAAAEVFACLEIHNPAILDLADGHRICPPDEIDAIVDYATEIEPDLALVTTAAPLEHGLADAFAAADVPCFAPERDAARLEWDKAFARELLADCCPEVNPEFRLCSDAGEAKAWAAELEWQVAIKPPGLTSGLGVKVVGDQLANPRDAERYIEEVCARDVVGNGDGGKVVVEEKLFGEEFTLQALVNGRRLTMTPPVQDFKKLLDGDRGPNTASMGSYSEADGSLPFLRPEHLERGQDVMTRTLSALEARTGARGVGFLYGQFMLTASGLKLIEYNFRPGDPEWLNTLGILEGSLLDCIEALSADQPAELEFRPEASVVKYLVPPDYPRKLDQTLSLSIDHEQLAQLGVRPYISGGGKSDGELDVGSERGIALLACAERTDEAHEKIERALDFIEGEFRHRTDIGSSRMLRAKARERDRERTPASEVSLRPADDEDARAVKKLARRCPPLEAYPRHQYKILLRHAGNVCCVAESGDGIQGYVMGIPSARRSGVYFMWQIGVAPEQRGTGLGRRLLAYVERRLAAADYDTLEVTVDPENDTSCRLFEAADYRNISRREGPAVRVDGRWAVRDYYGPDAHFVLFEKRLGSQK